MPRASALAALALLHGGLAATVDKTSMRGGRYCEVMFGGPDGQGNVVMKVHVNIPPNIGSGFDGIYEGSGNCPQAQWENVTKEAVQAQYPTEAFVVSLNGPRIWMIDASASTNGQNKMQQALMNQSVPRIRVPDAPYGMSFYQQAQVTMPMASPTSSSRYLDNTVARDAEFTWRSGKTIYTITASDGSVYVMQSYSRIVDAGLAESDLAPSSFRARLTGMPSGWTYGSQVLGCDLKYSQPTASVLQDSFSNSYTKFAGGLPACGNGGNAVNAATTTTVLVPLLAVLAAQVALLASAV